MLYLYNLIITVVSFLLNFIAVFSPKIALFVKGRKNVFKILENKLYDYKETIWFHAASLGEYEQGLPVIENVKSLFPEHKIVLTFFSPSGFEVKKNNIVADITVYLPLDTNYNVKKFLDLVNPKMVFFIKYEFWPNYLHQLKKRNIDTYLISGIFRKNQIFFKNYGGFYRNCLSTFKYFFVQNTVSKELLESINIKNTTVSGDTRFDRVYEILNRDNQLDFIDNFLQNLPTIVAGSTWKKDEELLVDYINSSTKNIKFIIAPHNIKKNEINDLKKSIIKKTILFSKINNQDISKYEVLIVDTIGLLTKIYSKATLVYVGGGFGNPGVHNVLEPAVFGIPIIVGKNYSHFQEAQDLVDKKGITSITNEIELQNTLDDLLKNIAKAQNQGKICHNYVMENKGATGKILEYLKGIYLG